MTLALVSCAQHYAKQTHTVENEKRATRIAGAADGLAAIALIVIGILSLLSVVALPPAAAFTLLGVGGGIGLISIIAAIRNHCAAKKAAPQYNFSAPRGAEQHSSSGSA